MSHNYDQPIKSHNGFDGARSCETVLNSFGSDNCEILHVFSIEVSVFSTVFS